MSILAAWLVQSSRDREEFRKLGDQASYFVATRLKAEGDDEAFREWSSKVSSRSTALQMGVDRESPRGIAATRFAKAQQAMRDSLSNPKLHGRLLDDLIELRTSIKSIAGDGGERYWHRELVLGVGVVAILAVLLQAFYILKALRWRIALIVRTETREILQEMSQVHDKDVAIVEEKATQALRAKQADLEAQAEALRMALSKAEDANLVKTAFLGNVSHEIRTPLNGILATSELLAQTPLDEEQTDLVNTVVASGDQLTKIIGDILDIAQMEAGGLQLEIQPFDTRDLVREVVQPYQALAMAKGVTFEVRVPDEAHSTIASDPVRVRQILTNLVSNAAKFTHKGKIEVELETVEVGPGMVELRMNVSDTGIGIDASRLPTIFERFNQADNSSKRTYGGTGLGLTIAKQLVEVLGGQIGVNSERGVGTQFMVALPVQASSREAIPSDQAPIVTEIPHLGMKVLVAEDNLVNQRMMQKLLQRCACSVDLAENGAEAVERALFGDYDVILMDVHMPVMDGVEATVEIRRKEREWNRRRTPIIAVTADVMEERRRKFLEAGMDNFVPKPVRLATLLPVLTNLKHSEPQPVSHPTLV
ncbi:MAG TPA: ATP-binding protein [Fimbriimonas sp.]